MERQRRNHAPRGRGLRDDSRVGRADRAPAAALSPRAAARTGAAPTCAVGLGLPCAVPAGSGAATARWGHAGPWVRRGCALASGRGRS